MSWPGLNVTVGTLTAGINVCTTTRQERANPHEQVVAHIHYKSNKSYTGDSGKKPIPWEGFPDLNKGINLSRHGAICAADMHHFMNCSRVKTLCVGIKIRVTYIDKTYKVRTARFPIMINLPRTNDAKSIEINRYLLRFHPVSLFIKLPIPICSLYQPTTNGGARTPALLKYPITIKLSLS